MTDHAMFHALYARDGAPTNDPALWVIAPADKHGDGSVVVKGHGVVSRFQMKAYGDRTTLEGLRAAAKAVFDLYTPEVEAISARHLEIETAAYALRRRKEQEARAEYEEATGATRRASGDASRKRWEAVLSLLPPL